MAVGSRIKKIDRTMTKRKKRSLERDINILLYKNLTREGISMDHLDPSRLRDWPLHNYSGHDEDYVNLLPPSYRDPFTAEIQKPKKTANTRKAMNLRESLSTEWSATLMKKYDAHKTQDRRSHFSKVFISVSGALFLYSIFMIFKMLPAFLADHGFSL